MARRLIDALLLLALAGSLLGLGLPWLTGALAQGGALPAAMAAGAVSPDTMSADILNPGSTAWLIDLAAHWQLYAAAGWALLLTFWCLRGRRARLRWLPLLALAGLPWLSAAPTLDWATQHRPSQHQQHQDTHTLRIAAANVHVSNRDPRALIAWLRQHPVDALVVTELSPAYAESLAAALPELPHHALYPQAGSAFGIGLLSRKPLRDVVLSPDADGIPALGATVMHGGRPLRLVGVHPMPPVAPRWHGARDRLLHGLATGRHPALGPDRSLPRLVAGDLNATPWSSALHLAAGGGLRRATGLGTTWPMQWGGHLGIPIDHVLGSAHWQTVDARRGPGIGGDHAPIRVELRLSPLMP